MQLEYADVIDRPVPIAPNSFAAAVGKARSTFSSSIPLKLPSSYKGEHAVFFTEEKIASLASPFKFALVGKFSHERPSMPEIKNAFKTIGLKSSYFIGLLDPQHVLIRFHNEEDYHRMWLREIWYLTKYHMRVFKWTSDFRVDVETSIASVWVNLPQLPVHLFDQSSLFSIAQTIGSPVKTDVTTAVLARPSVARVCVEMDLLKKFLYRVWIGNRSSSFWQTVEYKKNLKYCVNCNRQGHDIGECKIAGGYAKVLEGKSKECHCRIGSNMIYKPVNMACNEGVLKAKGEDRNRETEKEKQLIDSIGKVFGQISFSPLSNGE